MHEFDVIIVGASFAGLTCGAACARAGMRTLIIDRKKDLTRGIHTTGIYVAEAQDAFDLPQKLCHFSNRAFIYGPRTGPLRVKTARGFATTDTGALLLHMAGLAQDAGAQLRLDTPFSETLVTKARWIIGADGARSRVARHFGLGQNRHFLIGAEMELAGQLDDPGAFHLLLCPRRAPGYVGWVIQGPQAIQVGTAGVQRPGYRPDARAIFDFFDDKLGLRHHAVIGNRGGLIPVGGRVQTLGRDRTLLLGDAAGIVSPLTAGGIKTAHVYGQGLADALIAFEGGQGPHPLQWAQVAYPKFRVKGLMRSVFEQTPGWAFDMGLRTLGMGHAARRVLFGS